MKILSKKDIFKYVVMAMKNDKTAINVLLEYENDFLFSFFYKFSIQKDDIYDLIQTVLIKISKNIVNLSSPNAYVSWVRKIATNTLYDYLRNKHTYETRHIDLSDNIKSIQDFTTNPYRDAVKSEFSLALKKTINMLPRNYKLPMIMREFLGLSYIKISKNLSLNIGTVKSRISRGRTFLKQRLRKIYEK